MSVETISIAIGLFLGVLAIRWVWLGVLAFLRAFTMNMDD